MLYKIAVLPRGVGMTSTVIKVCAWASTTYMPTNHTELDSQLLHGVLRSKSCRGVVPQECGYLQQEKVDSGAFSYAAAGERSYIYLQTKRSAKAAKDLARLGKRPLDARGT